MLCVSVNLTGEEWSRIQTAAARLWPQETLSRAEIVRRYALVGIDTLKHSSRVDRQRVTEQLQNSMTAADTRLRS